MYTTELLNRFIGDRFSNVAISPAWPWARKLNDRSINSLIPAVRTSRHRRRRCFLRLFSRRVLRYTFVRIAALVAVQPHQRNNRSKGYHDRKAFARGRYPDGIQRVKIGINTRHKRPMDIFISGVGFGRTDFTFLGRNCEGVQLRGIIKFAPNGEENFPLGIKFSRTRASIFARASAENLRDDASGSIAKTRTKQFTVAATVSPTSIHLRISRRT